MKEYNEYDDKGNLVYYKNSNMEMWWEYDINDNEIHFKSSSGYEYWSDYDENDNCIYSKDSDRNEFWYNVNGNKITEKEYILSVLIKWRNESNERV